MSCFSMICFFRVPGAGLSRHASDIKKIYGVRHFIKTRVNGGATTKLKNKLIEMIKNAGSEFDDYSISPKIRQILLHWGYELTKSYL